MAEITERPIGGRAIVVAVIAIVIVTGVLIAVASVAGSNTTPPASEPTTSATETTPPADTDDERDDMKPSPSPLGSVLPEALGGQAAIDALGDKITLVASRNGKSVDEVKELLLRDETAKVSTSGFIKYVDDFGGES